MKYCAKIYVSDSVLTRVHAYLSATSPEDFQPEDETIVCSVEFTNGYFADVKCCGCQDESSWTEMVLFDSYGVELACTDVDDSFDQLWELEYDGDKYLVEVLPHE